MFRRALCSALLLAGLATGPAFAQQGCSQGLSVTNGSGVQVWAIYLRRAGTTDWGVSRLGGRNMLAPRSTFYFPNLTPGVYDVKVRFDGSHEVLLNALDICRVRNIRAVEAGLTAQ